MKVKTGMWQQGRCLSQLPDSLGRRGEGQPRGGAAPRRSRGTSRAGHTATAAIAMSPGLTPGQPLLKASHT